jgi:hypothetical protein
MRPFLLCPQYDSYCIFKANLPFKIPVTVTGAELPTEGGIATQIRVSAVEARLRTGFFQVLKAFDAHGECHRATGITLTIPLGAGRTVILIRPALVDAHLWKDQLRAAWCDP